MTQDAKSVYAQSSDIKSRTYLQYRKDMKKKAIAELEITEWLEDKIREAHPKSRIKVSKSGGDKFVWFLRGGGVSREPDFIAEIDGKKVEFEFQYAEKADLRFYDFKVSKVAKKKRGSSEREPIANKSFVYIHKPLLRYAIFSPEWVIANGQYGMVAAWRSYAFRVPKDKFERLLNPDRSLGGLCRIIDSKNYILDFQHELVDLNKEKLSHLLQGVIDEQKLVRIVPKDLASFFNVCFILDNINKVPTNGNLWLIYVLSHIGKGATLEELSKIVYCIDFLYSKARLKPNEVSLLASKVGELFQLVTACYQKDGSYKSSLKASPLDETRYALFTLNLLEDLIQDMIFCYSVKHLKPVRKIYENVADIEKTCALIKGAHSPFSS